MCSSVSGSVTPRYCFSVILCCYARHLVDHSAHSDATSPAITRQVSWREESPSRLHTMSASVDSVSHSMTQYDNPYLYIDGERVFGAGRDEVPVINPSNEAVLGSVPVATKADLDRALDAAERGFAVWRKVSAYERAKVFKRAAQLLVERREHLARLMTLEQGKTLPESQMEIDNLADILDWDGEEGRRCYGRVIPARAAGQRQYVVKEPVGPVATFTPWNYPALIPIRKVSAVLAAGCSCIIKPAEETAATTLAALGVFEEAGLPPGVLNIVFGVPAEISSYLIASPVVRAVSFTGSTAVGKQLSELAARGIKRTVMELGGHAPVIIFDDVKDLAGIAEAAALRKYRNAGQGCVNPSRYFVQASVFEEFTERFTKVAAQIKVSDGFEPGAKMGPLAHARRLAAMESIVDDARSSGAQIRAGGGRIGNRGFFWRPTVVTLAPDSALLMREEPFGPAVVINPFSTFDEAVAKANNTAYGLAAYAFTNSGAQATAVADALQAGMVGINTYALGAPNVIGAPETPFGGIKESGYGSEGGIEGIDAYLSVKLVSQF
jgi:succinate-semialdehyde dehydrogenase / glutarate-semialdehyde dehydrogenase